MKFVIFATVIGLLVGPSLSGVITLTSQGLQYLNNEQFAALQDPEGAGSQTDQQAQQGIWNGGQSGTGGGGDAPQVQYDDDEDETESEQDDNDEEVEEPEENDDEKESEEKDVADDKVVADETLADDVEETKGSKYKVKTKVPKVPRKKSSKKKVKEEKVKESEEEADDDVDDEKRPPPPMPDVLKQEMMMSQYDTQGQGVHGGQGLHGVQQQPGGASPPLLSRMASFLGSLIGRGGLGSDPIYMNRNAKSISGESAEATSEQLTRTKRQLGRIQVQPFYHVRNNIRTMVRRQPNTILSPRPIEDFSTLNDKGSKPIKLFMDPYAAPATYQSPPLSPAQGVRAPPSTSGLNPGAGGLGSPGLGQGTPQSGSTNSGGGNRGSSGGQKNSNKQSGNKGGSDKESEEDSEENDSDQYPDYGEEDEESDGSAEDVNSAEEEDNEDDEDEYESR